jgi:hypothetical protein
VSGSGAAHVGCRGPGAARSTGSQGGAGQLVEKVFKMERRHLS